MANGNGEALKSWYPLIAMLIGLAVTWGSLQTQVNAIEEAVKELKETREVANQSATTEKIRVEVLATKQTAILDDVKEIKETQKDQGKKLDQIINKLNQLD